ncbi:E3 ubiquitin-protein ligase RNF220 isoform X1 [Lingula anatina]|uniref:E3 ubiquitin-protein ligase RNF220 isoform X1 n=1 Tax=Lingula anatina TaxID=7574 RepID=A0A1S3J803_LINAN|nr:E3 ubiquitin-protein ligase RNF220 isoform X1 [Lingula anatina]|eukprot:XP_013405989.1 E3 ubiquitin-protein ligase RNF220 isoform X1 [Lingula anatina]
MFRMNLWTKPFFFARAPYPGTDPKEMANPSFQLGPNPLASPALMVLASTAEAAREAGHIAATSQYQGQGIDGKEMPVPFTTAYAMYRQGEGFPPPMYAPHLAPHLMRPMGMINPNGGGAFRPVTTASDTAESQYHSAFIPAKRPKIEETVTTPSPYHYNSETFDKNARPQSQDSNATLSPAGGKDELRGNQITPNSVDAEAKSESSDRATPEEGRNLRKQRKRNIQDGCCPVCGLTLRTGEMESHLIMEIEKLDKICRTGRKGACKDPSSQGKKSFPSPSTSSRRNSDSPGLDGVGQTRFETYLRIKANRQNRLAAKARTNKRKRNQEETSCPVCNEKVIGTPEELNEHVEKCLKKRDSGEEEVVDIEGDQFEEYEWAGQKRIRASSLLQGGMAGSGFQTSKKSESDEDINLDVDGDDSEQYGGVQYTEADIIPCSADDSGEDQEREALRGAVLRGEGTQPKAISADRSKWSSDSAEPGTSESPDNSDETVSSSETVQVQDPKAKEVIQALKAKVKDQEDHTTKGDKFKCLICMEPYASPLTSIQCWHVHCEECWLRTLGAKKLCPQCNMITSAADLRKIYL